MHTLSGVPWPQFATVDQALAQPSTQMSLEPEVRLATSCDPFSAVHINRRALILLVKSPWQQNPHGALKTSGETTACATCHKSWRVKTWPSCRVHAAAYQSGSKSDGNPPQRVLRALALLDYGIISRSTRDLLQGKTRSCTSRMPGVKWQCYACRLTIQGLGTGMQRCARRRSHK